jgi:hypothetical protein
MPVIEIHTIKATELNKGDKLVTVDFDTVVTGKKVINPALGRVAVERIERKTTNVVVTLEDTGSFIIKGDAELQVERSVPTEEEREAEKVAWRERSLSRSIDKAIARPDAITAQMVAKASEPGHWTARDMIDLGIELAEANALKELCLDVLLLIFPDGDSEPMAPLAAYDKVAFVTTRRLVQNAQSVGSRSTSVSSNLSEDAINAARAKFIDSDFSGNWS